jgi:Flp pilus assembly pilin Flp
MTFITNFIEDQSGANSIEYAMVMALISTAAIGAFGTLGNNLDNIYSDVSSMLVEAKS